MMEKNRSTLLSLMLSFLLICLFAGCARTASRTIPKKIRPFVEIVVDEYEDDASRDLFAKIALASPEQIDVYAGGLDKKYQKIVRHDPRLDAVANIYATAFCKEKAYPASGLVEWTMNKMGVLGIVVDMEFEWIWRETGNPMDRLNNHLFNWARRFEGNGNRYNFGIATIKDGTLAFGQVLIIVEKPVELSPLPKHYKAGEKLKIEGRFLTKNQDASFRMTLHGPESFYIPVNVDNKNGEFKFQVPVPPVSGRYYIEMNATRSPGLRDRVLRLPIYVNMDESSEPEQTMVDPPPNPSDQDSWPQYLINIYNKERAKYGIKPLLLDSIATALANEEAARLTEKWHRPSRDLRRMLEREGINTRRTTSGFAWFESLVELFEENLKSPWFKEMLYDEQFEFAGLAFKRNKESNAKNYLQMRYFYTPEKEQKSIHPAVSRQINRRVDYYEDSKNRRSNIRDPTAPSYLFAKKLESSIKKIVKAPVTHNPSLDALAISQAEHTQMEPVFYDQILWKMGLTGTWNRTFRRLTRDRSVSSLLLARLKAEIDYKEAQRKKTYSFGIARIPRDNGMFLETIVIVEAEIGLEPMPKYYEPGQTITISGRYLDQPQNPQLLMDLKNGKTQTVPVEVDREGHFSASVPAPDEPGRHILEMTITPYEHGKKNILFDTHTALYLPIYIGKEKPEKTFNPVRNSNDRSTWGDIILGIYNAERKSHGLAPLVKNPVANALIADYIYQKPKIFNAPTFKDIRKVMMVGNGETPVLIMEQGTEYIEDFANQMLTMPSFKKAILDSNTQGFGFGLSKEGYQGVQMLIAKKKENKIEDKLEVTNSQFKKIEETIGKEKNLVTVLNCYQMAGESYGDFEGEMTINIALNKAGQIVAASPELSTLEYEGVEVCIVDAVRKWKFANPQKQGLMLDQVRFSLQKNSENKFVVYSYAKKN